MATMTKEMILKAARKKDIGTVYELKLSDMKLEAIEEFEELVKLRDIDISRNQLSSIQALDTAKELRSINAGGNVLTSIPSLRLAYLQRLDLSKNKIGLLANVAHLKVALGGTVTAFDVPQSEL